MVYLPLCHSYFISAIPDIVVTFGYCHGEPLEVEESEDEEEDVSDDDDEQPEEEAAAPASLKPKTKSKTR